MINNEQVIMNIPQQMDPSVINWPPYTLLPIDPYAIYFENMKYGGISLGQILNEMNIDLTWPISVEDLGNGFRVTEYTGNTATGRTLLRLHDSVVFIGSVHYRTYTYNESTGTLSYTDPYYYSNLSYTVRRFTFQELNKEVRYNPTEMAGLSCFGTVYSGHSYKDSTEGTIWYGRYREQDWMEIFLGEEPEIEYLYYKTDIYSTLTEELRERCLYNPPSRLVVNLSTSLRIRTIRPYLFYQNYDIGQFICDGIMDIGAGAFAGCQKLTHVQCNGSHGLHIGAYAFSSCRYLSTDDCAALLGRCSQIDYAAFGYCTDIGQAYMHDCLMHYECFQYVSQGRLILQNCSIDGWLDSCAMSAMLLSNCTIGSTNRMWRPSFRCPYFVLLGSENIILSEPSWQASSFYVAVYAEEQYIDLYKAQMSKANIYPISSLPSSVTALMSLYN